MTDKNYRVNPNCLPGCGMLEHEPLCPVAHTVDEIEIALLKVAIKEAHRQIAAGNLKNASEILETAISGRQHDWAEGSKHKVETEAAQTVEEEKHVKLRCVVCGHEGKNVALNEKGYAKCVPGRGCAA